MPQARFLEFLVEEARRYPAFRLVTGASVRELIVEGGVVRGVRYRTRDGQGTVRAPLTVGADGRFSRLRHLIGFEPIKSSVPMDVLWFRIPRRPGDPEGVSGRVGNGHIVAMLDRGDQWQVAYVISKGTYRQVRDAGISELRRSFAGVAPDLADRLDGLTDWKQMSLLSVEASRLARWYTPGLLLIGDAAHVMSPVAGVGINYAIQDAVAAANILSGPLKSGRLRLRDLAAVQREREWPTRIIQAIQSTIQQRVIAGALDPTRPVRPPLALRLPLVRRLFARVIAYGVLPTRLKQ
jgi:2-polyprenyl-6-methoxyphenol hydroxylase-like FAD-dependent oxidoreductase